MQHDKEGKGQLIKNDSKHIIVRPFNNAKHCKMTTTAPTTFVNKGKQHEEFIRSQ